MQAWEENTAKTKLIISLTLSDGAMAKKRVIVDEDTMLGKELWEEHRCLYRTSNHEAITNLINRLISVLFEEKKKNWETFLSTLMSISNTLGS